MSTSKICRDWGAEELEASRGWRCHQCGGALQPPLRTFKYKTFKNKTSFLDRLSDASGDVLDADDKYFKYVFISGYGGAIIGAIIFGKPGAGVGALIRGC